MTVGDIHWVELSAADDHEQGGRRPGVILQDDAYGRSLPLMLVVPLTTARAPSVCGNHADWRWLACGGS
ncbi:MAG: type II toxin-antitoxin system PemK/MazF family toxin [Planctomycetota bacterium]|nr:type II toxin-antitoxin system PemK/MazF family toxin [Planctomycetota bacterium]